MPACLHWAKVSAIPSLGGSTRPTIPIMHKSVTYVLVKSSLFDLFNRFRSSSVHIRSQIMISRRPIEDHSFCISWIRSRPDSFNSTVFPSEPIVYRQWGKSTSGAPLTNILYELRKVRGPKRASWMIRFFGWQTMKWYFVCAIEFLFISDLVGSFEFAIFEILVWEVQKCNVSCVAFLVVSVRLSVVTNPADG